MAHCGRVRANFAPMLFLQFVTSPLSSMFMIAQKQQHDLMAVFPSNTGERGFLGLVSLFHIDMALISSSFVYSVMYAINGMMTYEFAKNATR